MKPVYWCDRYGTMWVADVPDDAPTESFGIGSPCPIAACHAPVKAIDFENGTARCDREHGVSVPKRRLQIAMMQVLVLNDGHVESRHDLRPMTAVERDATEAGG